MTGDYVYIEAPKTTMILLPDVWKEVSWIGRPTTL